MGLEFLIEWVIGGWTKLSKMDFFIILLILIVIVTINFQAGVGIGVMAMLLLFVVNYSRINAIDQMLTGVSLRSNVERPEEHWEKLRELGQGVIVIQLKGYLFFGTAHGLYESIREQVQDPSRLSIRYVLLDFRRVNNLDSSAVYSFILRSEYPVACYVGSTLEQNPTRRGKIP